MLAPVIKRRIRPPHTACPKEWDEDELRRKGIEGLIRSMHAYIDAGFELVPPSIVIARRDNLEDVLEAEREKVRRLQDGAQYLRQRIRILESPPPGQDSPAMKIVCEVADKHEMTFAMLLGESRSNAVSFARQEAMYRLRMELGLSYPSIGGILGKRDSSTIQFGVNAYLKRMQSNGKDAA